MDNVKLPIIFDAKTGEVLATNKLKPKNIENFLKTLDDKKVSEILTQLNFVRKIAEKIEKATKNYVKTKIDLDFTDEMFFEEWRLKKIYTRRFDEKKLLKEGTKKEIKMWNELKTKYSSTSEAIKFG